jgi:hypothetical protein
VKATYTALGSIVALLAIAHLFWGDQPGLVRDFAPELATEVLGILITLVFVRRIIDRRAQEDRARFPWRCEAIGGPVERSLRPLDRNRARMPRAAPRKAATDLSGTVRARMVGRDRRL